MAKLLQFICARKSTALVLFILLLTLPTISFSATFYSISSGAWSISSNWTNSNINSTPIIPATSTPGPNDIVFIMPGHKITADGPISCRSLYIQNGSDYNPSSTNPPTPSQINAPAELSLGVHSITVTLEIAINAGPQSDQSAKLSGLTNTITAQSIAVRGNNSVNATNYTQAYLIESSGTIITTSPIMVSKGGNFEITSGTINCTQFSNQGTTNFHGAIVQTNNLYNQGNLTLGTGTIEVNGQASNVIGSGSERGTFNITSGNLNVSSSFTNSGIFNLGAGKAIFGGHFTNQSANTTYPASFKMEANSEAIINGTIPYPATGIYGAYILDPASTIIFGGTTPWNLPNFPDLVFGNLEIHNPAIRLATNISSTNLVGYLSIRNNGKINNKGFSINVAFPGKAFTMDNTAELILEGNTTLANVTSSGPRSIGPASTITYSNLNTSPTISSGTYGKLVINSSKTLTGDVTLEGASSINAPLNLAGHSLIIGDNDLIVSSNGSITGASIANYVKVATGKVIIDNLGTTAKTFPIGTTTSYTPAIISNIGTTQSIAVGVKDGVSYNGTTLTTDVVNKTWEVTPAGSGADISLTLQWNTNDQAPLFSPANCILSHYDASIGGWETKGTNFGPASGSGPFTLTRNNLTSFSPFAIGGPTSPLPVELISFTVTKKNSEVALTWETASEKNNAGFEVQTSADGKNYDRIGFVSSWISNSSTSQRYAFSDKTTGIKGLIYYRLKQIDLNGGFEYSAAKVVDLSRLNFTTTAQPNPFTSHFELNIESSAVETTHITMTDMTGRIVYAKEMQLQIGKNSLRVALKDIPAGLYIIQTTSATQNFTNRLLKQ